MTLLKWMKLPFLSLSLDFLPFPSPYLWRSRCPTQLGVCPQLSVLPLPLLFTKSKTSPEEFQPAGFVLLTNTNHKPVFLAPFMEREWQYMERELMFVLVEVRKAGRVKEAWVWKQWRKRAWQQKLLKIKPKHENQRQTWAKAFYGKSRIHIWDKLQRKGMEKSPIINVYLKAKEQGGEKKRHGMLLKKHDEKNSGGASRKWQWKSCQQRPGGASSALVCPRPL